MAHFRQVYWSQSSAAWHSVQTTYDFGRLVTWKLVVDLLYHWVEVEVEVLALVADEWGPGFWKAMKGSEVEWMLQ